MTAFESFRKHIRGLVDSERATIQGIADGSGVARSSLHEYLKGDRVPGIDQAERIAAFLGYPLADMLEDAALPKPAPRPVDPDERLLLSCFLLLPKVHPDDLSIARDFLKGIVDKRSDARAKKLKKDAP